MTDPRGKREELGAKNVALPKIGPYRKLAYTVAGVLCLALGVIGAFLPVLPTTPFVLLAAACFYRGSERMHRWMLANRWFGPMIRDWQQHRAITRKIKVRAMVLSAVTIGVSTVFFVPNIWGRVTMAVVGVCVLVYLSRLREIPAKVVTAVPSSQNLP